MTTRRARHTRTSTSADLQPRRPADPATSSGAEVEDVVSRPDIAPTTDEDAGVVGVADDAAAGGGDLSLPPSPCRHQITRTRQQGGRIVRFCERCGAETGTGGDDRYVGPVR